MRTSLKVISILILSFLLRDFFGTNSHESPPQKLADPPSSLAGKAEFLRIYSCHSLLAPKSPLGIEEEEEGVFARISISELGQIQEIIEKDGQGLSEAGKQRLKKAWGRVSILYPGLDLRELIILEKEADLIETSSETKRISIGKNVLKTEALLHFTLGKGMFQLHIENELSKQRRDKDTWKKLEESKTRLASFIALKAAALNVSSERVYIREIEPQIAPSIQRVLVFLNEIERFKALPKGEQGAILKGMADRREAKLLETGLRMSKGEALINICRYLKARGFKFPIFSEDLRGLGIRPDKIITWDDFDKRSEALLKEIERVLFPEVSDILSKRLGEVPDFLERLGHLLSDTQGLVKEKPEVRDISRLIDIAVEVEIAKGKVPDISKGSQTLIKTLGAEPLIRLRRLNPELVVPLCNSAGRCSFLPQLIKRLGVDDFRTSLMESPTDLIRGLSLIADSEPGALTQGLESLFRIFGREEAQRYFLKAPNQFFLNLYLLSESEWRRKNYPIILSDLSVAFGREAVIRAIEDEPELLSSLERKVDRLHGGDVKGPNFGSLDAIFPFTEARQRLINSFGEGNLNEAFARNPVNTLNLMVLFTSRPFRLGDIEGLTSLYTAEALSGLLINDPDFLCYVGLLVFILNPA